MDASRTLPVGHAPVGHVSNVPIARRIRTMKSCATKSCATPRSGFTLVELLTVIVIIGILVGLLVGAVFAVRAYVGQAVSHVEVKKMEEALLRYKSEIGEFPPDFYPGTPNAYREREITRHIMLRWPQYRAPANSTIYARFTTELAAYGIDANALDPSSSRIRPPWPTACTCRRASARTRPTPSRSTRSIP